MKIGTKVVLMRGKRYGLLKAGRYEDVRIATLESIEHGSPDTRYHFSTRHGPITMVDHNHTKRWPDGWHPQYIDCDLPSDEEVGEKLMSAIEAVRCAAMIHIGAVLPDQGMVLGTIVLRVSEPSFGHYRAQYPTIILEMIDAKPGDLVVGKIHHADENDVGQPRFKLVEPMVIAEGMHLDQVVQNRWPIDKLMSEDQLEEHITTMFLRKQEDLVLFYTDGNDVSVIAHSGLCAHQSSDLSSDVWHWGNGEEPGFYLATDLSWAGCGEDVELEADVAPANDEEVARVMLEHGIGSSELVDHDLDDNAVMRIAAQLGDEDEVLKRRLELEEQAEQRRREASIAA
jgi:hypothetical protein